MEQAATCWLERNRLYIYTLLLLAFCSPSIVLIDPGTYIYWNATFQKDQSPPASFPNQYNTDLVKEKALGFLDIARKSSRPFFIGIAPIGPHAEFTGAGPFTKPVGATRHEKLFTTAKAPRSSNWNPKEVPTALNLTMSNI
jgi:N-acetylglucosamine-6-sulfatase